MRRHLLVLLILCLQSLEATGRSVAAPATVSERAEVVAEYGYRYYAADVGKWLNSDPLAEIGGLNLYALVTNSPISRIDRLGLVDVAFYNPESPSSFGLAGTRQFELAAAATGNLALPAANPAEIKAWLEKVANLGQPIENVWLFDHGGTGLQQVGADTYSPTFLLPFIAPFLAKAGVLHFAGCNMLGTKDAKKRDDKELKKIADETERELQKLADQYSIAIEVNRSCAKYPLLPWLPTSPYRAGDPKLFTPKRVPIPQKP